MKKNNYITELDYKLLKEKYHNLFFIKPFLKAEYPVQYLIGNVNFYGYTIYVNRHVLIPRFETEQLCEELINLLKEQQMENAKILELGTGSGCISITLKKELPNTDITAIEKYSRTLKVAKKNAKLNNVDIEFIKKDMLKYTPLENFDVIISNPPYLTKMDDVDSKIKYEPHHALYAKENGLYFYNYIINKMKSYLNKKSILAFEIGETQGDYLKKYAKENFPSSKIIIKKIYVTKIDFYL